MKEIRLGSVLIKNRHKRGITQDELAAYLGVSKAAVSKWETAMTYPDITLLPRLAAYFNISIDELMGYEPQMDKMEIRKCYLQFAEEFSMLSFEEVLERCHEMIKKYHSCYPFLFHMGVLLVNHFMLAGSPKRSGQVLEEARELFNRIKTETDDPNLSKESLQMEAYCLLILKRPEEVLDLLGLMLNYILPVFFLIIPLMSASIMSASSFVGEKEKQTLETLLYCPLSVKQIFCAKVMASFLLSMTVSLLSFLVMLLVLEAETVFFLGKFLVPGINWLIILLLIAPSISLMAITLIVRGSAKAQSVEEAQQGAVFLVLPLILLATGQFMGVLLINVWILLVLGGICALAAVFLLKKSMGRFTYELLLK